ncbi:MAG: rhodanese-like domain-containing protein [Clostridiales bacterium]|nr:rhodanese-like domain-containing protein [Clostridiales bacterium]
MDKLEYFKSRIEATISPMEFMQVSRADPAKMLLVDVRNAPPEKMGGKIVGALHIPQSALPDHLSELPRDRIIVVYCWDVWCNLAARAAITLLENGFDALELIGGFAAWNALYFPTENL